MRPRTAAEVAELAGGAVVGDPDVLVGPRVVIDSREADPGSLFVALPGEHVDGHTFTSAAAEHGAVAALVTQHTAASLVQIVVADCEAGLSSLARGVVADAKANHGLVTLAVTGSSGKTSTKDLLAQVLESVGNTVAPQRSFNNEIGVPLTACGVDDTTKYLVSEMGARAPGQLRWLVSLVPPTVAAVLNVGTAHLGEFGSRQGIAQAKGEIIEDLGADDWAVLNADDPLVASMATRTRANIAWFSISDGRLPGGPLLVRAAAITSNALDQYSFDLEVVRGDQLERHPVHLGLMGAHQVPNAAAGAAMAIAAGVEPRHVADALTAATTRSHWRMELHTLNSGAAIINDAYNANPDSVLAALESLSRVGLRRKAEFPGARTIAVIGDMLELGEGAQELHRQIGRDAGERGIDEVVAVGEHAAHIVAGALEAGVAARVCAKAEVAGSLDLHQGDVVLVKASRSLALEEVADQLIDRDRAVEGTR